MRHQLTLMLGIVALAVAGLVYTFAAGNEPLLGLDLQGGISVVLEPEPNPDGSTPSNELIDQAIDVIRNRVDGLGVREPEISRQGSTVLVQIPGVDDKERALDLVGQTAELRFRPVIATGLEGTDFSAQAAPFCTGPDGTLADAFATGTPTPDAAADECMIAPSRTGETLLLAAAPELQSPDHQGERLTGLAVDGASARFVGAGWTVSLSMKGGSPGIDDFNALAAECFDRTAICPTARAAIEVDGFVESAPTIQARTFSRSAIQISGNFTEGEAKDLALVLRFGSLPVQLTPQESVTVSSTLGSDALNAGLIAGGIGLGLVSLYLFAYYRILGLTAIASLVISGALLWTIVAWLGASQGLALTLAGVTGLIVSIGVSVDSNVVYFEHLKEEVKAGRSVRAAVERAFPKAYSTIVSADIASLIAAVVLYFLTVGSVKGFALFLGLATVLDLIATYFFLGPAIRLLSRRESIDTHGRWFGFPQTVEVDS